MKKEQNRASDTSLARRLDWFITLIPFLCIVILCIWFVRNPEQSSQLLASIRSLLGDQMGRGREKQEKTEISKNLCWKRAGIRGDCSADSSVGCYRIYDMEKRKLCQGDRRAA